MREFVWKLESVFCTHVYVMTSINKDISNLNVKKEYDVIPVTVCHV